MEPSSTVDSDKIKEELLKKLTDIIQRSSGDEILQIIGQQAINLKDIAFSTNESKTPPSDNSENDYPLNDEPTPSTSSCTNDLDNVTKQGAKPNLFDNLKVFPSRPGSAAKGREYEIKMTALLALRCAAMEDTQDMWLGSNVHQVGDFDDIVLCRKTREGKCVVYLIQLKHQDVPKNVTQRDFTYTAQNKKGNKNKSLEDFSLAKYYKGFVQLKQQLDNPTNEEPEIFRSLRTSEIIFILFTNRNVSQCDFLLEAGGRTFDFLNTNAGIKSNIYKFDETKLSNYDSNFLQHLLLAANQIHVSLVDKGIKKELKNSLAFVKAKDEEFKNATDRFVTFINVWSTTVIGNDKDSKFCHILTKRDVINKITDILLEPYKVNFSRDLFEFYDAANIWNKITSDKLITIIDSDDSVIKFIKKSFGSKVRKYFSENKKNWADCLSKNALDLFHKNLLDTKLFKINENNEELTVFHVYRCLWFNKQLPLLVEIKSSQDCDVVIKILKLSNYNLRAFIIKGDTIKLKLKTKHFVSVDDLKKEDQDTILNVDVRLQGKSPIKLGSLASGSTFKSIKCKDIIHILQGNYNIGVQYELLADYFIFRSLFKVRLKFEVLTTFGEIFVIENVADPNNLLIEKLKALDLINQLNFNIFIINEINEQVKKFSAKKVVHRLVFNGDDWLVWVESFGNTKNIIKHQFEQQEAFYNLDLKNEISHHFFNSVHLINGSPGMGKTVLMDFIALHAPNDLWVLKITLNEHNEYYEDIKLKKGHISATNHLKYFNDAVLNKYGCVNNDLAQYIFQKKLNEKKVLILLDGFDEISISYKDEVTEIAKCLQNEKFPLWITTRPHMKFHLEVALNTIAIDLKPFTLENQKTFLTKYFSQVSSGSDVNSEKRESIIGKFVEKLLEAARINLSDRDQRFTGVPLQTKLLADVFSSELKNSLIDGVVTFNRRFNLLYLYEEFIKRKTKILCSKYGDYAKEMNVFFSDHQKLLALEIIFDKRDLLKLEIDQQLTEYYKDKQDRLNILQREGLVVVERNNIEAKWPFRVNFVHRTFAEFLAAQWLTENYNNDDCRVRMTVNILISNRFHNFETDFSFLFTVFDSILSKGLPIHNAIICRQVPETKRLIKSDPPDASRFDAAKRSVVHLIALYDVVDFWTGISSQQVAAIVDGIPHLTELIKMDAFGFNPLDYAVENKAFVIAEKLCQKLDNISITVFIETSKEYIRTCNVHQYKSLFKKLFQYEICFKLLEGDINENKLLTDCLPSFYNDNLENIQLYLNEFNATTVSEFLEELNIKCDNYYCNLWLAVAFGSMDNICTLLCDCADINKRLFGFTPLHYAIKHNRSEICDILFSQNPIVDIVDAKGNTALHFACKSGNYSVVEKLLARKASINERNKIGETPLFLALTSNHFFIILLLLQKNANGDGEDRYGNSCLHVAAQLGHYFAVQYLINKHLHVNKTNEDEESPLHVALKNGNTHAAELLMTHDADINMETSYNSSCLHFAARSGLDDIVSKLINKGLDINKLNKGGIAPLHYALQNKHRTTAKLLLSMGADINNDVGGLDFYLHLAITCNDDDLVQDFIHRGIDVNMKNNRNEMPLLVAVQRKHLSIAKLLLLNGANIDMDLPDGNSLLHYAAKSGCLETWLNLVNETNPDIYKNTDFHIKNNENETLLHYSFFKYYFATYNDIEQQTATQNFLLNNGVDGNVQNKDGNTVLHYVSKYGYYHSRPKKGDMDKYYENAAQLLLDNNVELNLRNKDGKTALELATECGHNNIVCLIQKKGRNLKKNVETFS